MKKSQLPLLALTMGDPCGIGPEIILRAVSRPDVRRAARLAVFGNGAILERVAKRFGLPLPTWQEVVRARVTPQEGRLTGRGPFLLESTLDSSHWARLAFVGRPSSDGGTLSCAWIALAVNRARAGLVDGVVTAPISKEALHLAGLKWPGHTEMIAAWTETRTPVMMMAGASIRAALVTTHAAIEDLPRLITKRRVLETIRIVDADLRRHFGLRKPRIAVCGLNPHAGEHGLFGKQDMRQIAPAVKQARAEGISCKGPIPADVVFTPGYRKRFDATVAMYHDQATIPVKMLAFDSGVNITLGLPIIRTSPDHGTAYDIAARGVADPGSMVAAILTAAQMARARRGTR